MAGPFATSHLKDFGAEVIKVEHCEEGDNARFIETVDGNPSGYFANFNRGKKSIAIDFYKGESKEIVLKLIKDSDIMVVDFRDKNYRALDISYLDAKEINKKIVYASVSGFGEDSVINNIEGYDNIVQAMAGTMDLTGFPQGVPTKVGASIGDGLAGLNLSLGILMAQYHSKRTGKGQKIEVSKLASLYAINEGAVLSKSMLNESCSRVGNTDVTIAPYDVYKSNDGYISIGVASEPVWPRMCKSLGFDELIKEEKYMDNELRIENYSELRQVIEDFTIGNNNHDLEKMMLGEGVPCSPVLSIGEIINHPQIEDRSMVQELTYKNKEHIVFGQAMKIGKEKIVIEKKVSTLGEDTVSILSELGYSAEEIDEMKVKQII
jgi:CoA:oxalate CoA-transferase